MDATDFLNSKRLRLEREKAIAVSKIDDYRAKAVDLENRVKELDILLSHIQKWEVEGEDDGELPQDEGRAVPIRALAKEFLKSRSRFVSLELVTWIQARSPLAKENSIRAELSLAKKRGDVELIEKDCYRSTLFFAFRGELEETEGEVNQNEPGPEFGKIISRL